MSATARGVHTTCLTTLLALSLGACAVSRISTGSVSASNRFQISPTDMTPISLRVSNAYDIVRLLRPWMLTVRDRSRLLVTSAASPNDANGIRVYVDDISLGGIDVLRDVPSNLVVLVEWVSAIDATTRYGGGHLGGVIAVTTRVPR